MRIILDVVLTKVSFSHRYAPFQDAPLAAYEYGAHEEDWKQINETHQHRLARWSRVVADEKSGKTSSPAQKKEAAPNEMSGKNTSPARKKAAPESLRMKENKKTVEARTKKTGRVLKEPRIKPPPAASGDANIAGFRGVGTAGDTVELKHVSVPMRVVNDTDTSMMCVVCQENKAEIVFEPCHHCVLCSDCSETTCKTFCLSCRTTITGRLRPSAIHAVRPRIYSSYSFM